MKFDQLIKFCFLLKNLRYYSISFILKEKIIWKNIGLLIEVNILGLLGHLLPLQRIETKVILVFSMGCSSVNLFDINGELSLYMKLSLFPYKQWPLFVYLFLFSVIHPLLLFKFQLQFINWCVRTYMETSEPKSVNSILQQYSRRGASDSVTDFSMLSNPADAQNVSCLGLCGRDICPKSSA